VKRPFISVVVPTMRVGGLDILIEGLRGQTFRDFELVLVDAIERRIGDFDFAGVGAFIPAFTHVKPFENEFPVAMFCQMANTGLAHARGEVVFMMVDYTWLPPHTLAEHATWHRANPQANRALLMPHEYRVLPPLKKVFADKAYKSDTGTVRTDNAEARRYAADVVSGALNDCMFSIFEHSFFGDARELEVHPKWGGADPKNRAFEGRAEGAWFHAKNESIKLEALLAANGWDEDLDGTHCFQDSDIADRLTATQGMEWYLSKAAQAQIINPRTCFPFAERQRDYMSNELLWKTKRDEGYPERVNSWSIVEKRKELGL
jgi:hypothetical protein